MRDIASLRILAMRAVGPPSCNPEVSFGGPRAAVNIKDDVDSDENEKESPANANSNAMEREKDIAAAEAAANNDEEIADKNTPPDEPTMTSRLLKSLRDIERPQQAYQGPGRPNANDVDISHPWIMAVYPPRDTPSNAPLISPTDGDDTTNTTDDTSNGEFLAIEYTNPAVECIQQFIDALVESGRAGDTRMGVHFFREWVFAVAGKEVKTPTSNAIPRKKNKKRKISISAKTSAIDESLPLGALSLHNFSAGSIRTFRSMEKANIGSCLGTLDVSGVHGLTDSILTNIICGGSFPRIQRLSLKNCRKLTGKGIASLVKLSKLKALDVGGCFNVHPNDVLSLVESHPSTKRGELTEIYAGGLGWTDVALEQLVDATVGNLRGLGIGFSPYISGPGLILTLSKLSSTLDRLAVPFCAGMDDAAISALGSKLPKLAVLDIRGCNKVFSISGMLEGRAGVGVSEHLFVLARYSGISNNSLQETMKLYDAAGLTCVLDSGGNGGGIRR